MDNYFGEIISSYSRSQAIADGELIDVTETAREAGFSYPMAITRNLWHTWTKRDARAKSIGQDTEGRLWDILWMLLVAIKKAEPGTGHITYEVIFQNGPRPRADRHIVKLWAICGPGDHAEPVITIMLPEDY